MIEVLQNITEFCLWGLLALVTGTLLSIGIYTVVIVIRRMRMHHD